MDNRGLHAYIVCGADPAERESLAYSLAQKALGGKNYSGDALAHPDLHEISPDGAEIKVAQAREVREMSQIRPNEAERQVFIFHDADRMNNAAQNALLATIEEPSTPCLFLFVCANERALLPTIRSRCALVRSNDSSTPPPASADVDPEAASRLAQALMLSLSAVDSAEAVLPLAKLKGTDAAALVDAARAACLRAAARSTAGSDEALRALAGADFAAKCLDLLSANVSPAQVAAHIVAKR